MAAVKYLTSNKKMYLFKIFKNNGLAIKAAFTTTDYIPYNLIVS